MRRFTVLLVEADTRRRRQFEAAVAASPRLQLVASCASLSEARGLLGKLRPRLALLALDLLEIPGPERARGAEPGPPEARAPRFSRRERVVLQLIVKGHSYARIGEALGISINTVREHIRRIYRKLSVRSRGEAVYKAQMLGVVRPGRLSHIDAIEESGADE